MALSNGSASMGGHEMQGWQLTARDPQHRYQGSLLQPHTATPPLYCLLVSASYMPPLTQIQSENRLESMPQVITFKYISYLPSIF